MCVRERGRERERESERESERKGERERRMISRLQLVKIAGRCRLLHNSTIY